MSADNSIELFNCSLCSFCETSLDRLACHIRQHIKPEPTAQDNSATIAPRSNQEISVVVNKNGETSDTIPKKSQDQPGDVLASTIDQLSNISQNTSSTSTSSRTDVSRPLMLEHTEKQPVSLYGPIHNKNLNNAALYQQHKLQPSITTLSASVMKPHHQPIRHPPPPMMIETAPQLRNNSNNSNNNISNTNNGKVFMTSPLGNPSPTMMTPPNEGARYVQRNDQHQHFMKSQQHMKQTFYKPDYVPIAPAKTTLFQEVAVPMETVEYRRSNQMMERNGTHLVQNVSYVSPPQRNMTQISPPGDVLMRPVQPVEVHSGYQIRQGGNVDEYRFASVSHNQQIHTVYTPPQMSQHYHHTTPQQRPSLPPISYQQQQHRQQQQHHHQQQNHLQQQKQQQYMKSAVTDENKSTSRYHSQVSGINFSEVTKHQSIQNVSVPNSGSVMLKPEQILAALTNNIPKEQLAGLLIVPLKKTSEIGVQTDPVEIGHSLKPSPNKHITCGVQTELRMRQISEEHSKMLVPVFDSIRSTDGLYECLVCAEEFASDHHLQEHVIDKHTHVCNNCFHASTNITEHQQHVAECGKYEAEMLCMDCNNLFSSIKKLNQHRIKVHSVRMPFRCGICNVPFESHDAVMLHMTTHNSDIADFKCRYCTKVFQCAEALGVHVDRHKGVDVEYECRFCKKSFSSDKLLQEHIGFAHVIIESPTKTNNNNNKAKKITSNDAKRSEILTPNLDNTTVSTSTRKYSLCPNCDLAFKNKELLARHMGACSKNLQLEVSQFTCDVCKEFYSTDILRRQHIKKDHRRPNGYRCPKCSKIYRTWSRLKFHTKQQHLRKVCTDCNMIFTKEHVLRKHQEDVHGKSERQEGDRVYTCSLCNATMYTLTGLMNHRRDVHPELKAMKTADQSSSATMLSIIDDPMNVENTGDKVSVLNCLHCNEIFTSNTLLTHHVKEKHRSLPDEKKQPKIELKDHSSSKITCHKCDASFEDERKMKNHLGLTHGERPFVCDICNKRFQYSSQIVWHVKNIHKQGATKSATKLWKGKIKFKGKPTASTSNLSYYLCHFCGARFRQEKLLKNHKGTVHKIKLFSCSICSMKFGHSTELIWHIRTCKAKFARQNPGAEIPTPEKSSRSNGDPSGENGISDENAELDLSPSPDEMNDSEVPTSHVQLSEEEGEELLKNDPEYDSARGEYMCSLCQKTTKTITGMKTHYGRVHGVWGKETSHKADVVTVWPCQNCDQEFQTFEEISSHSLTQHGISVVKEDLDCETRQEFAKDQHDEVVYTCPHCGISFDNTKSIRVHAYKKHGILINDTDLNQNWRKEKGATSQPPKHNNNSIIIKKKNNNNNNTIALDDEPRFKCPRCKARYRSTKALRVHSFKRHGIILSKAELHNSKESSDKSASLKTTIKSSKGHDLVKSTNPCDKCGRVFGNYRALFTHYRQAHRIMDTKNPFVPKKPSRTELAIQSSTITSPESQTTEYTTSNNIQPSKEINQQKHSLLTAESIDCPKCSRVFTNHKSFVAHLFSAHRISKDQYSIYWPNGMPILPRESSHCPTCDKECMDERAMRIHMFKAHGTYYRDYEGEATKQDVRTDGDTSLDISCCVCSEPFRTQRALVAHEFKQHGVKWIGLKRVFPEDFETGANESDIPPTMVEESRTTPLLHETSEMLSPISGTESPREGSGYDCPKCGMHHRNRRAITTHLCRVHRFKKMDIQLYFSKQSSDAEDESLHVVSSPQHGESFIDGEMNKQIDDASQEQVVKDTTIQDDDILSDNAEEVDMILPRDVNVLLSPVKESIDTNENPTDEEDNLVIDQTSNNNDVNFEEKSPDVNIDVQPVLPLISPTKNDPTTVTEVIPVPIVV